MTDFKIFACCACVCVCVCVHVCVARVCVCVVCVLFVVRVCVVRACVCVCCVCVLFVVRVCVVRVCVCVLCVCAVCCACVCALWIIMVGHQIFADQHGSIADHNRSAWSSCSNKNIGRSITNLCTHALSIWFNTCSVWSLNMRVRAHARNA